MWSELVDMIAQRCQDRHRSPQQQARAAMLLYGGLTNCQVAFANYKQHQSDVELANAVFAIDALISVLQNIDSTLSLLEPQVARQLKHYALEKDRLAYVANPKELLKMQVELLRGAVNAEVQAVELLTGDLSAFTGAKNRLAEFIQKHFTSEEVFECRPS
ncbi:MAG: hypothetical protein ACREVE_14760 [Gammaproteobacteria bacterium]